MYCINNSVFKANRIKIISEYIVITPWSFSESALKNHDTFTLLSDAREPNAKLPCLAPSDFYPRTHFTKDLEVQFGYSLS